jgi:hypothetical protein
MIDDDFKIYLIEVNTNTCLDQPCPLLSRFIPSVIDSAFRIAVDPLYPPPENFSSKKSVVNDITPELRYELIFDEDIDGPDIRELMKEKNNIIGKSSNPVEIDEEELSDNDEVE